MNLPLNAVKTIIPNIINGYHLVQAQSNIQIEKHSTEWKTGEYAIFLSVDSFVRTDDLLFIMSEKPVVSTSSDFNEIVISIESDIMSMLTPNKLYNFIIAASKHGYNPSSQSSFSCWFVNFVASQETFA